VTDRFFVSHIADDTRTDSLPIGKLDVRRCLRVSGRSLDQGGPDT
jgi:hypothetical protein